jgi:lysophospholipase L1-like esterase
VIKISIFLFLILCSIKLVSQDLKPTSPIRFLALGDSYTIGQSVPVQLRWPVQLLDSLEVRGFETDTLRIIATTGWRTDNLINAINNKNLEAENYNLVSLLIGVNNQYQNRPFSQYVTEFPALLDSAIRYAGGDASRVFVVSIPDYAYTPFGQGQDPAEISMELDEYNAYNRSIAETYGITYFDITPISRQGLDIPSYVASDGLHPSGEQYTKWVELMLEYIDEQITSTESIPAFQPLEISISPNPADDVVKICIHQPAVSIPVVVEIYNLDGSKILYQKSNAMEFPVNTADLMPGMYIVKVRAGQRMGIGKLIRI